jgi:AraC family transcriptional regulator
MVILAFEGEEPSAAATAERLVYTLEIWVAAVVGEPLPPP